MASETKLRFPLIPINVPVETNLRENHAETFGTDMSLIHNVFIRALNSMHQSASIVKNKDKKAFAGYCVVFADLLHEHHHMEEEIIFPFLQTKIDMNHNVEQHHTFSAQITAFRDYMENVRRKKEEYDAERVHKLLEAFADHLVEHLHDEIPTISPANLAVFDAQELDGMMDRLDKHLQKSVTITRSAVLVITHHDVKEIANWPPIPGPAKWIVKNITYWRYRRYWKFSPFNRKNRPQVYGSTKA